MSDTTSYSEAGLSQGITALSNANSKLTSLLEELKSQLGTSLADWDDNARLTYQAEQDGWNQSAQRQQEIVAQMPRLLTEISDGYSATERSNAAMWG